MYQAAIAGGKTVSLTYVKLLALGPGQVGKSTFLYRLLGLMRGNIKDTPKEAQPQSSTGQSELREVCIKYKNTVVAAAPDLSWELCGLQSLVEGLMWLLSNQTQDEDHQSTGIIASSPNINRDKLSFVPKEASPNDKTDSTENRMIQEQQTISSVNAIESTANTSSRPEPSTDPRVVTHTPLIALKNATDLINKTFSKYEELRVECKHSPNVTKLHMLFNIADVGGQPAFLDMFPSLTIGPALYLLFTKLINDNGHVLSIDDLSKLQPVQYRAKHVSEPQNCENYMYTLEEVLFCALSSIACFGISDEDVEKYVTKEGESQRTSSLALLLGTFTDEINEEGWKELVKTEAALRSLFEATDFYRKNLISFPNPLRSKDSGSHVFFRVNNKTGSEDELIQYKKLILKLVKEKFRNYDIPAAWLALSICLKILAEERETYKVSFDDCVELGKYFNLSRKEIKVALTFLHKYIGLIIYFPNDKNLQNLVICNPQVVFWSISELTFNIYDSSVRKVEELDVSSQQKEFEETGIFNPNEVTYPKESSRFLSVSDLVHLLLHLNIIAKIPTSSDVTLAKSPTPAGSLEHCTIDQDEKSKDAIKQAAKYFFPAVLRTANPSSFLVGFRRNTEGTNPEPLCLTFQTGYMPMGFTCTLIARLMGDEKFQLLPGEPVVCKNMMKFRFSGQINITMISLPLRCEFHIFHHHGNIQFHDRDCCPEILNIITKATDDALKSLQNTLISRNNYTMAFMCPLTGHHNETIGHESLAKLVYVDSSHTQLKHIECLECATTITDLKPEMKVWFGEVRATMLSVLCVMSTAVFACRASPFLPRSLSNQL